MIAFLRGNLIETTEETAIIDCNGVGYEVHCSGHSLDDFFGATEVKVYVYSHVREDLFQLFGFSNPLEKKLFLSLIKVNGIGPKMALNAISGATVEQVISWIENGDVKALTKLPKVGKKKAEQIILSLKGKLVFVEDDKSLISVNGPQKEILSALVNLGYKEELVKEVLSGLDQDLQVEEGIRKGLSLLSGI